MSKIHAPTYTPTKTVALVHDSDLREAFVANALIWVAMNFDAFKAYIAEGAEDGDDSSILDMITTEIFDLWIYPIVSQAADHARQRAQVQFGAMDLSNLGDVLAHLAGDE